MDRLEALEREVEFLRKLVLAQNAMVEKLLAERALGQPVAQPPQIIPVPYPVPAPCPSPLPGIPPYIPPMYPWEPMYPPLTPFWEVVPFRQPPTYPEIICETDAGTVGRAVPGGVQADGVLVPPQHGLLAQQTHSTVQ